MLYRNHHFRPRQGIILLVVLALLTLFASIGVAFVYFSEAEVNKSAGQKTGETVKLPDADLLFNIVMKQIIFPTTNSNSALITHSLLENMYGRSPVGVANVTAFNGTGRRPFLYRDTNPAIRDFASAGYPTNPLLIGQDEMFRINFQQSPNIAPGLQRSYVEQVHGSLNPPYTYPDHKNAFLGSVAANWIDPTGSHHGPVAVARSFTREIKLRIAVIDTNITDPMLPNLVRYHEVSFNPYSSDGSYGYWNLISDPSIPTVPPAPDGLTLLERQNYFVRRIDLSGTLEPGHAFVATPGITANRPVLPPPPDTNAIQVNAAGVGFIVLDRAACLAHTMRPNPRLHPNFPPPSDLGGDVKNLPPEVKTLVGFNGTTPVFANNDSYWLDFGFPALPWSNNRKIKPMAALYIMDNDGKLNLNIHGNMRGQVVAPPPPIVPGPIHASGHGLHPSEVNLIKLYPTSNPGDIAQALEELRSLHAGSLSGNSFIRGKAGFARTVSGYVPDADPVTDVQGYAPLVRTHAPFYSLYNLDGTNDGLAGDYVASQGWQLAGDLPYSVNDAPFRRFPYFSSPVVTNNGFSSGDAREFERPSGVRRSPWFLSPYVANQASNNLAHSPRKFGYQNQESLYRMSDTGSDKLDSELRKLVPTIFATPQRRWQTTVHSADLNQAGISPWISNTQNYRVYTSDPNPSIPAAPRVDDELWRRGNGLPVTQPIIPPNTGEFSVEANYYWRSAFLEGTLAGTNTIFGNNTRLDLARQLPDFPVPVDSVTNLPNNNRLLNIADPVVSSLYNVALTARQRMANQIYNALVNLTHPDPMMNGLETNRWLAQLAVNIVDYIDNDDYPTWFTFAMPGNPAITGTVWGTELPRLVINEVYCEARNNPMDTMSPASNDYDVHTWVELYNPLMSSSYPGVWPGQDINGIDPAEARLNVGGNSVYRLIITPSDNTTNIRNPDRITGDPDSISAPYTQTITFPPDDTVPVPPVASVVAPSNVNYGTGVADNVNNPGFCLVGPGQPEGYTAPPAAEPVFPNNNFTLPSMIQSGRIPVTSSGYDRTTAVNRQAVLLQRLANPYLPPNPVPGPLYNPYITIDYVQNIEINNAIRYSDTGNNGSYTPVEQRSSQGKLQPYAAVNRPADAATTTPEESLWVNQRPRIVGNTGYTTQPQHTFLHHNAREAAGVATVPTEDPNGITDDSPNTLKMPFDWLVHLDRAPTSPVDLLHISGYKPHELTQQFNRTVRIDLPPMGVPDNFPTTLTAGSTYTFRGKFVGARFGIPYSLKNDDLVRISYTVGVTTVSEWVRAKNVILDPNPNLLDSFEAETAQTQMNVTACRVELIVPFSHYAPWYRALEPNYPSSNRLYRLLECLAVRNAGINGGQYRFTSNIALVTPFNTNNISDPLPPDANGLVTRWIQLDNGYIGGIGEASHNLASTHERAKNYALFGVAVGESLVVNAGTTTEQRIVVQQIDFQNNRIRAVLDPAKLPAAVQAAEGTFPMTLDYCYLSGQQQGKVNLNTVWDVETFRALADAQRMNSFFINTFGNEDNNVILVFDRIYQQRQPGYFNTSKQPHQLPGFTGLNNIPEDRPFQGMGIGDIAPTHEIRSQGIINTFLSDRYRQYGDLAAEATDVHRITRTLFEIGNPGQHHPHRRFEMLSKIWNNTTVRSNTFSVWMTIGFFEYDEATNSIGAELGQLQGKNTRYRFFSVVDRTVIDQWLKTWNLHEGNANVMLFADTTRFPTLDPRMETYPTLNGSAASTAIADNYIQIPGTFGTAPGNPGNTAQQPGVWLVNVLNAANNPFNPASNSVNRLVEVLSEGGFEVAQMINHTDIIPPQPAPAANQFYIKLTINHTGRMTIRPLPVPPTVLHWSQLK